MIERLGWCEGERSGGLWGKLEVGGPGRGGIHGEKKMGADIR